MWKCGCDKLVVKSLCAVQMAKKVRKMAKVAQRPANQEARKGEADRRILCSRPKHLFTGKRGIGKTDRR